MKHTTPVLKTVTVALFIGCANSQAANWSDNLYLNTDIGSAFVPDTTTHYRTATFDPNLGAIIFSHGKSRFDVDPGIRGDLSLGYHLNKSLAIEAEAGVVWNPGPVSLDNFYQIPVMLKVLYQAHLSDSWKAYIGGGAGGVIGISDTEIRSGVFLPPLSIHESDVAMGYEAETGIKYTPCRHVEMGLGYKFLGVDGYDFTYKSGRLGIYSNVRLNDLYTHTVLLSFTLKF
jgi:opacity protein-like surface antigen